MSIVKNIKNYINSKKVQRKQNEILKNTYERNYLFWGECEDSILVDNHNINYTKKEIFLADSTEAKTNTKYIKITGENINGEILRVCKVTLGKHTKGCQYFINENDKEFHIIKDNPLDENLFTDNKISGQKLKDITKQINDNSIQTKLQKIKEDEEKYNLYKF